MLLVLRMVTVTVIYLCATYICFAIYFSSPIYIYICQDSTGYIQYVLGTSNFNKV